MKLVWYMLRRFFAFFFFSLIFFVLILSLTDLLLNIWGYMSKEVPVETVCKIMVYYLPKTVWYSVPMAVLFSTAHMLSDFYAKNELLAMFASGISLFRFMVPLFVVALAMSFGLFFFEDKCVVGSYAKKTEIQNAVLGKTSFDNADVVVMSEGGKIIYKSDFYDDKQQRLNGLYVVFRNNEMDFDGILFATSASWRVDHWDVSGASFYRKTADGYEEGDIDHDHLFRLMEPPETFRSNAISVEAVTVKEAKEYIRRLDASGLPSGKAKSEYYKRYAFPFIILVVVLLAVGLSGKTRKNVLLVSMALSIGAVVLFYVMQMVTMLMAHFGTVPPVFGAWFPVVFFIFVSAVLLRYART